MVPRKAGRCGIRFLIHSGRQKVQHLAGVEKAQRRGKLGWDAGRHVQMIPHYRHPHLMLAWTETGRAVPKIVPRRGTIMHRQAMEKVPSGWEAKRLPCGETTGARRAGPTG